MEITKADSSSRTRNILRGLGLPRLITFVVLLVLLGLAIGLFWATGGAMSPLSFLQIKTSSPVTNRMLVDESPWQSARTLAPLAVSIEENELGRQAEHLADHEVDQAFAAGLRQARLDAQHRALNGEALALKQKIAELEQLRNQDQALVDKLTATKGNAAAAEGDDLDVAKAQLGLDTDELTDAQHDLERVSDDESVRIQDELAAREQSMKGYDSETLRGQTAVTAADENSTLAQRIPAWLKQRERYKLVQKAQAQALEDAQTITTEHNSLKAKEDSASTDSTADSQSSHLQSLQDRSAEREILSIDDDRIQTEQQLAGVYAKWAAQLQLEHRIALHLILGSLLVIVLILIAMLLCDALVRQIMNKFVHDRRQMRTLHSMIELGVQAVGVGLILLVIFGAPKETPTILGLTTAALTFALQDYIVAFLGWFTLMGKSGIHVGDWVEINGVSGEVADFRLMTTTLLETGGQADQGFLTGRRITFMNSYAIRGKFFNFSTAGQWMWDGISVSVPSGADIHSIAQQIEKLAEEETRENVTNAEREWRQSVRGESTAQFSGAPVVNLRPSGAGIELQLRYVTAADERFELRNRLYQRVIELLHQSAESAAPAKG